MNRSEMTRRAFTRTIASAVVASAALRSAFAGDRPAAGLLELLESETPPTRPLRVGMLLFPELTAMDLVGPQTVLSTHAEIHLIWKNKDLIRSDRGMGLMPDTTRSIFSFTRPNSASATQSEGAPSVVRASVPSASLAG